MSDTTPLTQLYSSHGKRLLVNFFLTDADDEGSYRMQDIADEIGLSRESVRTAAYSHDERRHLQAFGVIDVVEKGITKQLQLADTPAVEALHAYDQYPLSELLKEPGKRSLVEFFLAESDPEQAYIYAELQRGADVQYETVDKHLPVLIEAGLVRTVEIDEKTHYTVDPAHPITDALIEINEALYETYTERQPSSVSP
jgi:DNA-binding transcriptional ArsR family regulator